MAKRVRANTGRIVLGTKELLYCEGIEVDYDFSPIVYHAGDRSFPLEVMHGDSTMTINVDCAESTVSEEYAITTVAQDGEPVTVYLYEGIRGGGFPETIITNCIITNYTVTSRQGDVVKAKVVLQKRSDT